jgi:hypothetical protein
MSDAFLHAYHYLFGKNTVLDKETLVELGFENKPDTKIDTKNVSKTDIIVDDTIEIEL